MRSTSSSINLFLTRLDDCMAILLDFYRQFFKKLFIKFLLAFELLQNNNRLPVNAWFTVHYGKFLNNHISETQNSQLAENVTNKTAILCFLLAVSKQVLKTIHELLFWFLHKSTQTYYSFTTFTIEAKSLQKHIALSLWIGCSWN
jgi:hypothetical protein